MKSMFIRTLLFVASLFLILSHQMPTTTADVVQYEIVNLPTLSGTQLFADGKIIYAEFWNDYYLLYMMNPDGSKKNSLIESYNGSFIGSPDGNFIILRLLREGETSVAEGYYDLYALNLYNFDLTRLTNNSLNNTAPTWSPDGTQIAFTSGHFGAAPRSDESADIYIINAQDISQGTSIEPHKLTNDGSLKFPSWSPDSKSIIFASNCELYSVDIESLYTHNLTKGFDYCASSPTWSPTENWIAFVSYATIETYDRTSEIYLLDTLSSDTVRLTNNEFADYRPQWSPDGRQIAFLRNNSEIYVSNPSGTQQINLTQSFPYGVRHSFSWSPDGCEITFSAGPVNGNDEIFIVDIQSTTFIRLTENEVHDVNPIWLP